MDLSYDKEYAQLWFPLQDAQPHKYTISHQENANVEAISSCSVLRVYQDAT